MATRFLEIVSYIITAAATAALAWVGVQQILGQREERRRHTGRFDAAARYYAMLIHRSLLESVRKLNRDLAKMENHPFTNEMGEMSRGLNPVAANFEEMLKAMIEREGGSTQGLEEMLDLFYRGTSEVQQLADYENVGVGANVRLKGLSEARNAFEGCCRMLERDFSLSSAPQKLAATMDNPPAHD